MEVEMTEENQILCPSCGSCCLGTNEWIAGVARAALFRKEDGSIFVDYVGETEIDWSTSSTHSEFPYNCRDCGWSFDDNLRGPEDQ